jgi:hypothetical protein
MQNDIFTMRSLNQCYCKPRSWLRPIGIKFNSDGNWKQKVCPFCIFENLEKEIPERLTTPLFSNQYLTHIKACTYIPIGPKIRHIHQCDQWCKICCHRCDKWCIKDGCDYDDELIKIKYHRHARPSYRGQRRKDLIDEIIEWQKPFMASYLENKKIIRDKQELASKKARLEHDLEVKKLNLEQSIKYHNQSIENSQIELEKNQIELEKLKLDKSQVL